MLSLVHISSVPCRHGIRENPPFPRHPHAFNDCAIVTPFPSASLTGIRRTVKRTTLVTTTGSETGASGNERRREILALLLPFSSAPFMRSVPFFHAILPKKRLEDRQHAGSRKELQGRKKKISRTTGPRRLVGNQLGDHEGKNPGQREQFL
jgi:hypothetical protein